MDPLSIAASVVGLSAFVGKLTSVAHDSIGQVQGAESSLRNLQSELKSLLATLQAVAACLTKSNVQDALHRAVSRDEATAQLRSIEDVTSDCERALGEWSSVLAGADTGRFTSSGVARSAAIAWKLKGKAAEVEGLRNTTNAYNRTIQIHLQVMTLIVSTDAASAIQDVDRTLGRIKDEILRLRLQMDARHDSSQGATDTVLSESVIKKSLSISETTMGAASEYLSSISGTVRDDNTVMGIIEVQSIVDRGADNPEHLEQWLRDQHMEGISDEEDPEKRLASEVKVIATLAYKEKDYAKAERFLLKFFDLVKKLGGQWEGDELYSAYVTLANCYIIEKQYNKASDILAIADEDGDGSLLTRRAFVWHFQAQTQYMTLNFDTAKSYALNSIGLSQKDQDRSNYYNTTSLLADICEASGDDVEAEVYRRRVPPQFQPTRIYGFLAPKELGKTTKPVNEKAEGHRRRSPLFQLTKKYGSLAPKELDKGTKSADEVIESIVAQDSNQEMNKPPNVVEDTSRKWWTPEEEEEVREQLQIFSGGKYAKEEIIHFDTFASFGTLIVTKEQILQLGTKYNTGGKAIKWSRVKNVSGTPLGVIQVMYTKGLLSKVHIHEFILRMDRSDFMLRCMKEVRAQAQNR